MMLKAGRLGPEIAIRGCASILAGSPYTGNLADPGPNIHATHCMVFGPKSLQEGGP